jgi:hypothetical protein
VQLAASSRIRVYIPVYGPLGLDLTSFPCSVAFVPDGTEPADADYHPGVWIDGEATLKPPGAAGTKWGEAYDDGQYMAWVRVNAAGLDEDVRLKAGRVRIGELGSEFVSPPRPSPYEDAQL